MGLPFPIPQRKQVFGIEKTNNLNRDVIRSMGKIEARHIMNSLGIHKGDIKSIPGIFKLFNTFMDVLIPKVMKFKFYIESPSEILDIEIVSAKGERLVQTRIDKNRSYKVKNGTADYSFVAVLEAGKWYDFEIEYDAQKRLFSIHSDSKQIVQNWTFSKKTGEPERIVFRTGQYRLTDDVQEYKSGNDFKPGWDEPGADEKVKEAAYYIRDFKAIGLNQSLLNTESFKHHVDYFNGMEKEDIINHIHNAESWSLMKENIPLFECPDKDFEHIYYYRWWTYCKHIKKTPDGFVLTECITPVRHAGIHNTISCALGHHRYEGCRLKNQQYLNEYIPFWFRRNSGKPQRHFHKFSSWIADALHNRYLVSGDEAFLVDLLPDLISDYKNWVYLSLYMANLWLIRPHLI